MTAPKPKSPYRLAIDGILRNFALIISGRAVFGLINLAAYALAARAMPLESFGVVLLLQAYIRLLGGVLSFQAWKAVLTYGQPLLEAEDRAGFKRLIGLLLRLDICAILLAGAVAFLTMDYVSNLLEWPAEVRALAPWYTLLLIVIMPSTSVGLIRLFDRFSVLAGQHALNAVIRLIGAALIFTFGGGAAELTLAWGLATLISGGMVIWVAVAEAMRRGLGPKMRGNLRTVAAAYPGIWRFVGITNLSSIIENLLTHATVLIVGGVLGAGEAALFALARQITDTLNKAGSILGPIIFPEITRLEARGQRGSLIKLMTRTVGVATLFLVAVLGVLIFTGEFILVALYQAKAAAAYDFLVLSGAAAATLALGFSFEPTLLSLGRAQTALMTSLGAALIFGLVIWLAILPWGLVGVGAALLARAVFLTFSRGLIIYNVFRTGT